jgi:aryl-alcohol dehydrogenase-like predicted oxidoreductase
MIVIPGSGLQVHSLNLGGNVFGWTANEAASFAVLDAYAAAGGNFVDTADVYPVWAPGCSGGESETILGRWLAARGNRDAMVIATKVCAHPDYRGLSASNIRRAAEASLRRLGTDHIDLYYAHYDDPAVEVAETVAAFDGLVRDGVVRTVGVSNFDAPRLAESLSFARAEGLTGYTVAQYRYNLMERGYEAELREVVAANGLALMPYRALASGYLTGKYVTEADMSGARAGEVAEYAAGPGPGVRAQLARLADAYGVRPAAIALAWLRAQPTVTAPIASVTRAAQLNELLPFTTVTLSADDLDALDVASR